MSDQVNLPKDQEVAPIAARERAIKVYAQHHGVDSRGPYILLFEDEAYRLLDVLHKTLEQPWNSHE